MFKVNHLSKTFKTSDNLIKALDDVSFVLPSKGLVFVTGKSGTGKSTLLNLLGGLSKIDQGEIYFNDIKLNDLSENELSYYRNEYIGFMFQDFNIFDNLTVYQNIDLALTIKGEKNDERIKKEVERFELTPFINQKVNRLSVGQKERVALLRAIIKDPKVLLCDEPTGNLDTLTAKLILERLKEESRDKLVVVITHNLTEAYKYASRIIKLNEGKIVEDISYPYFRHETIVKGRTLYLNDLRNLTNNEQNEIRYKLLHHEINSIDSVSKLFVPTNSQNISKEETYLHKKRMKKPKLFSFHFSLFKKDIFRSFIYLFIGIISLSIFSMCLMFYDFDTINYFASQLDTRTRTSYNLTNFYINSDGSSNPMIIDEIPQIEKDIKAEGKTYIANTSISLSKEINAIKQGNYINFSSNYASFYAKETLGTIYGIDEEYLKDTYELDKIEITELAPYKKEGVYLTDYVYDSIRINNPKLKNIGGYFYNLNDEINRDAYINGVIKTNYLDYFKKKFNFSPINYPIYNQTDLDTFTEFVYELSSFFNVTYSFEKDYLNEFINADLLDIVYGVSLNSDYSINNIHEEVSTSILKSDEVREKTTLFVPLEKINSLTNKKLTIDEWNSSLKNKEIELSYHAGLTKNDLKEKVNIEVINDDQFFVTEKLFNKFKDIALGDFGIVVTRNNKEVAEILSRSSRYGIFLLDYASRRDQYIVNTLNLYKDFFIFIGWIVLGISLFIFLYLGYESVKRLTFEIGVLKGIGINIKDLFSTYLINSIYLFLVGTLLYFSTSFVFIEILNPLLKNALFDINPGEALSTLVVFGFTLSSNFISLGALIISLTLGTLLPILKIKQIKPIDILKRL